MLVPGDDGISAVTGAVTRRATCVSCGESVVTRVRGAGDAHAAWWCEGVLHGSGGQAGGGCVVAADWIVYNACTPLGLVLLPV